jgi:arylsulfatase A-like enzyme
VEVCNSSAPRNHKRKINLAQTFALQRIWVHNSDMKFAESFILILTLIGLSSHAAPADTAPAPEAAPPNILIILTDDQGLSDLSFYGNPSLETPQLDALARDSVRLEDFLAAPTCSPTRAALMTGQHEFKVGITHTISGRSVLKPGVPTLAEHFQSAGYRTGIFGKWHLGETYPSRPQDRGFEEVFIHLGGGIGQTPDYWGNSYFDPHIQHMGQWTATKGHCTQLFFQHAWDWIQQADPRPWLAYLALNAPHTPLQIDEALVQKYTNKGLPESQARFYALIDDIDQQMGRLLQQLDDTGLTDNTILVFMGDNGSAKGGRPDEMEYNAGLRGTKASPYQGGARVPCFVRWPAGKLQGGRSVDMLSNINDIFPTLAELAGIPLDARTPTDGRSLAPLLTGDTDVTWPERSLVTHVGRWPNGAAAAHKHQGSAIRNERFALVNGHALYDLNNDPSEQHDVAETFPMQLQTLTRQYDHWWQSVQPHIQAVPPIMVGHPEAPISHLTCMDWNASTLEDQGDKYPPWNQDYVRTLASGGNIDHIARLGAWKLEFARSGSYRITLRTLPAEASDSAAQLQAGTATLIVGDKRYQQAIRAGSRSIAFTLTIEQAVTTLETLLEANASETGGHGAFFVQIEYLNQP